LIYVDVFLGFQVVLITFWLHPITPQGHQAAAVKPTAKPRKANRTRLAGAMTTSPGYSQVGWEITPFSNQQAVL